MDKKATEMAETARSEIDSLIAHPHFRSRRAVYKAIAEHASVSLSTVQAFHNRDRKWPSVVIMDQLAHGIRQVFREVAK